MSVRLKLVAIVVAVALVPLIIATLTAVDIHRRAFDEKVRELHQRSATAGAVSTQRYLEQAAAGFELLAGGTIPWSEMSPDERKQGLWVVYRQFDEVAAVTLLDDRGGGMDTVFLTEGEKTADMAAHPAISMAFLEAFALHLPFQESLRAGAAKTTIGEPFFAPGSAVPFVPLALRVAGKGGRPWVVVTALSLEAACGDVLRGAATGIETFLIDSRNQVLCAPSGLKGSPESLPSSEGAEPEVIRYVDAGGRDLLAAVAPLPAGWRVLVQQPASTVFAASRRMRGLSMLWMGLSLFVALAAGLFLARGITRPIGRLVAGSVEMGQGNFAFRLGSAGRDEFGKLSAAFNEMAGEIQRRDAEIRSWNEELQKRVEERTRELQEAQDQILQSHKISAVSALAAGLAHEVNNPLAGVIAIGQLLKTRAKKAADERQGEMLERMEKEAIRIKEIVTALLSLAETSKGEERTLVDLNDVMDSALKLVEPRLVERKIEVVRELPASPPPTVLGEETQLRQVALHLLNNAHASMKEGGRLTVATQVLDGKLVKLRVTDTGKGIPPENMDKIFEPFFTTKEDWNSKGLGLSVSFNVVKEHHGTIKAESQTGQGTTMTVTLPVAKKGSMLV